MCLQVHLKYKHIKATFKVIKILAPTKLFSGYPVTLNRGAWKTFTELLKTKKV